MTVNLAIEYIPRRMRELGYADDYHLRFRHIFLQPAEQRVLTSYGQLFLLVEPPDDVRVESDLGLFDLSELGVDEYQYEHRGTITITNLSGLPSHVRFIQVIPAKH
jgi:hypothetical protein